MANLNVITRIILCFNDDPNIFEELKGIILIVHALVGKVIMMRIDLYLVDNKVLQTFILNIIKCF